jgi:hypothetical protein
MKDLSEIVLFYENLVDKNIFQNTEFNLDEYHIINKEITTKNQEFIRLVENHSLNSNFNILSLQLIYNKLHSIYQQLKGDIYYYHIPNIENTPLYKYEIRFIKRYLTEAYTAILLHDGIYGIYEYLSINFPKLEFHEEILKCNYVPAYLNLDGYLKHIYIKLTSPDCLELDFYGRKDIYIKKINDYVNYIPSEISLVLPIDFNHKRKIGSEPIIEKPDGLFSVIKEMNEINLIISELEVIFSPLRESDCSLFLEDNIEPEEPILQQFNFKIKINCPEQNFETAITCLIQLFKGLVDLNLVEKTTDLIIRDIFSNRYTESHIVWIGYKNSIAYFFRQIEHVYGLITISNPKWDVIVHYFHNKKSGTKFKPLELEKADNKPRKLKEIDMLTKEFKNKMKTLITIC